MIEFLLRLALIAVATLMVQAARAQQAAAPSLDVTTFVAVPPKPGMEKFLGTAWTIYATGDIDREAGARLAALLKAKSIPEGSYLYLHSPGGSIIGGLAIGRIARKHDLVTYVGTQPKKPKDYSGPGECMSACSLAFLGGRFRYMTQGSRYGVHRFSRPGPVPANEMAQTQVLTAAVSAFIHEMEVDNRLLSLMANTDATDILVLPEQTLQDLKVVYSGSLARWTIEAVPEGLYLKGEQSTNRGTDKFIVGCDAGQLGLMAMFPEVDPDVLQMLGAKSLMLDGEPFPIDRPAMTRSEGNYSMVETELTAKQLAGLRKAERVGVAIQFVHGAPMFQGFDDMATNGMVAKLDGFVSMCGTQAAR